MGKVYFPKEGVERIRVNKVLITSGGLGFITPQDELDKLVVGFILRASPCTSVSQDGQEMNSSYVDLDENLVQSQMDLKPIESAAVDPVVEVEPVIEVKEPEVPIEEEKPKKRTKRTTRRKKAK